LKAVTDRPALILHSYREILPKTAATYGDPGVAFNPPPPLPLPHPAPLGWNTLWILACCAAFVCFLANTHTAFPTPSPPFTGEHRIQVKKDATAAEKVNRGKLREGGEERG
jgi:hypothetical protein